MYGMCVWKLRLLEYLVCVRMYAPVYVRPINRVCGVNENMNNSNGKKVYHITENVKNNK